MKRSAVSVRGGSKEEFMAMVTSCTRAGRRHHSYDIIDAAADPGGCCGPDFARLCAGERGEAVG